MIDYFNFGFYPTTSLDRDNGHTIHDLALMHFDEDGIGEFAGSVLHEERGWKNFRMTDYSNSQGIIEKYTDLPDGTRLAERYDSQTGIYERFEFDSIGTLLRKECYGLNGRYEIMQRMPDGTTSTTTGSSLFVRMMNGCVPKEWDYLK